MPYDGQVMDSAGTNVLIVFMNFTHDIPRLIFYHPDPIHRIAYRPTFIRCLGILRNKISIFLRLAELFARLFIYQYALRIYMSHLHSHSIMNSPFLGYASNMLTVFVRDLT